jgi:glycosyltransferase involved in cell wall biosynthesis
MPKISVIIPVYKVEEYLRKCLDSVLAQTFQDYELILVDDGSPDNCGKICDEYALKDSRIRVIHKQNGGLSDARNAAMDIITGEYISFIDSDDYVLPTHLEELYSALIETDSDLAIGNITSVSEDKLNPKFYCPATGRTVLEGLSVFNTLNQPCAWAKLYKKFIFDDIRFPFQKLYEDTFIYHEILSKVSRGVLTGKNTYFYLIRSGSILHQEYRLAFTDIIDAVEARIKKLEELGLNDLADQNREFIYSRVAVAFANLDPTVTENKVRLNEIKRVYDHEYPLLIKRASNIRQKVRYWLLQKMPAVHSMLFGKRMNITLG